MCNSRSVFTDFRFGKEDEVDMEGYGMEGSIRNWLTLTRALDSIAYADRLAVAVFFAVPLADAFVGVVLEVGHFDVL